MSNLCSEILQVSQPTTYNDDLSYDDTGKDISCNLGSLNIAQGDGLADFGQTIETAIRALSAVSDMSTSPRCRPIEDGNDQSHAIGLGQMNLHGYLARERVHYGSEEGIDFTNIYFYTVVYHAVRASNLLAIETRQTLRRLREVQVRESGEFFDKYTEQEWVPRPRRSRSCSPASTSRRRRTGWR
jgi:ribonucleoside-diphosphate reductase alpha chain